jgi:hypothetical protein
MEDYVEEIARKLRAVVKEFGESAIENAVIVDSKELLRHTVCDLKYIHTPTLSGPVLGCVSYHVAKFFEDV